MKLLKFLPSWMKAKPVPVVTPSVDEINTTQFVAPRTPFSELDDYLSVLIATETETKSAHDLAVMRLNDYIQTLKERAETHAASLNAVYSQPTLQVSVLEREK